MNEADLKAAMQKAVAAKDYDAADYFYNQLEQLSPDTDFSFKEMIGNVPGSAAQTAKNLAYPFMHPIKTTEGVGKLAAGGLSKASSLLDENTPSFLDFMAKPIGGGDKVFGEDYEHVAEAAGEAIKGRYGSFDAALNTLEKDPVGALVDVAGVTSGVGALSKSANLQKIGTAINPINAAKNTVLLGAGKVAPKSMPFNMYEDVAKFSTTLPSNQRAAMVNTAIKNRLLPTSSGVQKLEGMIGRLNSKLDDLITVAGNKSIPKAAVYKHLNDLRRQKGGVRLGAADDLDSIDKIVGKFDRHMKAIKKDTLTAQDLQKLKVEAYKSINWDAKRATGTPIKEDTYKAIARGAKEGVEQIAPDVKGVNRQLGELYELQPALQRSANRIDQRNMIPIDAPLQTGVGASLGGNVGAVAGGITSFLGLPKIKAKNALRIQDLIDNANIYRYLKNNPNASMAELALIMSGRQGEASSEASQKVLLGR